MAQQLQFSAPPGMQQPSPEQIAEMQRQIVEEAKKHGMTPQQYVEQLRAQAMAQQEAAMRAQQQQGGQGQAPDSPQSPQSPDAPAQAQHIPLNGSVAAKPEALAVAKFLKSQELKLRQVFFNNERKDMFRVKRAIRALESPAYKKAQSKNSLLPEVIDRVTAENTFKLLPMSLLALRVSKMDPHEGHSHGPTKRVKGQWTVKVEQHQEAQDDMYYMWLYEGSQWKTKLYAVGALGLILAVVFFPVWPYKLRLGVWYLSMGAMGLLALFFGMAIFRLILFIITMLAVPPGIWLYPNLFEDVGFFDSFRPLWAWQETKESRKAARALKREKKEARRAKRARRAAGVEEEAQPEQETLQSPVTDDGNAEWEDEPDENAEEDDDEEGEEDEEDEDEEESDDEAYDSDGNPRATSIQVTMAKASKRPKRATVEEADD